LKKKSKKVSSEEPNDPALNSEESSESKKDKPIEEAKPEKKSLLQALPIREFCRLFWSLKVNNYHGILNRVISEQLLSEQVVQKMSYVDVQHVLTGFEMVPRPFRDKVLAAMVKKVNDDNQKIMAKESERTLLNILVKLTHLKSSGDHYLKIMKCLLGRKERLGSKSLSLLMWSISVMKPDLAKSERLFLQKSINAKMDSLKVRDVVQILVALHKITLDSEYHSNVANFDINDLNSQLINRLQLLRKQLTSMDIKILAELVAKNEKQYQPIKLLINS